jgi:NitT/TauT family transport system ATP-binding protein
MIAGLLPTSGGTTSTPHGDIGFVFGDPLLMPWRSAIENVLLLPELRGSDLFAYRQRARRLLGLVGAAECEESMPARLSRAAAARIAICRAAIHNPVVVLMDDPFRALDPLQREGIWMDLQRLWCSERFGVLMATTHVGEAVHLGDRVAILSDTPGRIVEIIPITVPRPRRMDKSLTPVLSHYINRVRTVLQAQGALP